jgi:hypothetical protein
MVSRIQKPNAVLSHLCEYLRRANIDTHIRLLTGASGKSDADT